MEGGRPSGEPADAGSHPSDEFTYGPVEWLSRFGGTELGCLCSLAVAGGALCDDVRPVRIELRGDAAAADGEGGEDSGCASPDDPAHHRLPIGEPWDEGPTHAWLVVETGESAVSAPTLDALGRLAACAGLMLERHRLDRDARRARQALFEARSTLAHGLRGQLHGLLIRTDTLLLALRQGEKNPEEIGEGLQKLKETLLEMTDRIRQLLERQDFSATAPARATHESGEEIRVAELLREMVNTVPEGAGRPTVAVDGDVAALRADRRRLASGLADLLDLARRSPGTPTFTVRPDEASTGVRVGLSLEPPAGAARDAASGDHRAAFPPPSGGEQQDGPGPSLRELLIEIGGRLRIEASPGTRVDLVLILPAG